MAAIPRRAARPPPLQRQALKRGVCKERGLRMAYNLYEGQCPVIGKLDNYHPGRRNYIRFFVDLADNSWFAGAVQMSVSPANSQPDEKTEEKSLRASNSQSPHKGTDASKSAGNANAAAQAPAIAAEQLLVPDANATKTPYV